MSCGLGSTRHLLKKKLPPGVLKKFREGVPKPSVINDIGGASIQKDQPLTVAPRYISSSLPLGQLVFHHMLYGNGSNGPHRTIVFRGIVSAPVIRSWNSIATRSGAGEEGPRSSWRSFLQQQDSPNSTTIPFALGTFCEALFLPLRREWTKHVAQNHILQRHNSAVQADMPRAPTKSVSSIGIREPWRVGDLLDPILPLTQQSLVVEIPSSKTDPLTCDEYIIAMDALVLDVTASSEALQCCRTANTARAMRRYQNGLKTKSEALAEANFDSNQPVTATVKLNSGDVVFVPRGFACKFSKCVGYAESSTTTGVTQHASISSVASAADASNTVVCSRLRYRPLPRLRPEQVVLYMASDYCTPDKLDRFYKMDGNSCSPQYL